MQEKEPVKTKEKGCVAFRLLTILKIVSEESRRFGTIEIQEKLRSFGYSYSLKTIQRDLTQMQSFGIPIYQDENSPRGWRIDKNHELSGAIELLKEVA
ncbi:MAG: hypothetical protein Q7S87_04840 [Agitococcus sp.]|nr:hypothetical protein [Agitococcus sp.]